MFLVKLKSITGSWLLLWSRKKDMSRIICFLIFVSCIFSDLFVPAFGFDFEVQQLQKHLQALSYDPGPADGVMGKKTGSALEQFKADRGISPSMTSEDVLAKLSELATEATGPDSETAAELQKLLTERGYLAGSVLGVWDDISSEALWLYLSEENKQSLLREPGKTKAEQHRNVLNFLREQSLLISSGDLDNIYIPAATYPYRSDSRIDLSSRFLVSPMKKGLARFSQPDTLNLVITDLTSGQQVRSISVPSGLGYGHWDINSDGRFLIFAGYAIRVVDIETGRAIRTFRTRVQRDGKYEKVNLISARPYSTEIIATVGNEIVIYDWSSGRYIKTLGEYGNVKFRKGKLIWSYNWEAANSLAISPDGRYLATSGTEFGIRVYDLQSRALAFRAVGKVRVSQSPGQGFQ